MADEVVKFGVDLDASGATRGAADASQALQRLDEQIADDTASITAMQKALRNLQGGSAVNIQQFKALKERIDAKKVSIAQAQSNVQTAALFAFGHGLALAALAPSTTRRMGKAALCLLLLGTLLFAGSLVGGALFGLPTRLAPAGGITLMLGWVLWAVDAIRR